MSYFADHLAWQQRVAQEFKATSSVQKNTMYQMNDGQWYNYPDLVTYLRTQENIIGHPAQNSTQGVVPEPKRIQKDDFQAYGYAPKNQVLYQRNKDTASQRSKTGSKYGSQVGPYVKAPSQTGSRFDQKSTLSKNNMQRFNEHVETKSVNKLQSQRSQISKVASRVSKPKSQVKSQISTKSQQDKKLEIYQAVDKLDEKEIDQIAVIIDYFDEKKKEEEKVDDVLEAEEKNDVVEEIPKPDDSATQVQGPTQSQLSKMSGKTYISQLQKQLDDEKAAREALETELNDLKKISSEITSELSKLKLTQ